jgi:UDP-glucose 4-epimerase
MNYLVTGGTGFIGAYAVRDLVREGHDVTVFDLALNREFLQEVMAPDGLERVKLVAGDVTDLPALLRLMAEVKPERIIHLAATLGANSESNPLRALKVNCEGTINVFEAALSQGAGQGASKVAKVVWASSIAVFGPSGRRPEGADSELDNAALHHPNSLYGACKSMNEQLARHYKRRRGLDSTGLRFSLVYGYGKALTAARGTGADFIAELIDKPALDQPAVAQHGDELLDWVYVEDAARAVVLASKTLGNRSIALNVLGDRATIADVAARVRKLLPKAQLEVRPGTWAGAMRFDKDTAAAEIGYRAQVSLEDGLRRNINALRKKAGRPAISKS